MILKPETPPDLHPFIPQVAPSATPHQNHSIKHPQIDITKFSGDVTEWQTFFDLFEVAVYSNNKLSIIEKINYSLSYLTGQALKTLRGSKLSEPNYSAGYRSDMRINNRSKFRGEGARGTSPSPSPLFFAITS